MTPALLRKLVCRTAAACLTIATVSACGDPAPDDLVTPAEESAGDAAPAMPADPEPAPASTETIPAETTGDYAAAGCGPVTRYGYCGVRWGMDVDTAESAFGGGDLEGSAEDGFEETCFYLHRPDSYDATIMIVDGAVGRIDVREPGVRTESGAVVGMSRDALLALYPDHSTMVNKYTGLDDVVVDFGNDAKAIFEMGSGDTGVTRYRVGVSPGINYVEGCS